MMATLIALGYALRKKKIVPENTGIALAKLETYIFLPSLNIINMLSYCNVESFKKSTELIIYGAVIILIAIAIAYPVSRLFIRKSAGMEQEYQRNIYKYALTFGNYGFMGNFIILGMFGDETLYKYIIFCLFSTLLCSTWGFYVLVPKENKQVMQNLKKGLLAPPMISLLLGIILGILGLAKCFPDFAINALESASKCMCPIGMVMAGIIIGGYNLREIVSNKKVYIVSILRLIVLPSVFLLLLNLLGASKEIMMFALICFGTPLGMNTIIYPAAYGGDTKTGASMAIVSSVLSIATIPLMYYVFIELL